ncbi:DUF2564 family protein [Fictibacillus enclensis]|uniref:Cytosolic protein n=1 Tax=Fictibacillus enclensis TaxID=1017270 RepID=A0A0V8JDN5_9BACL|nr:MULTISPECIES: DUF2564 family protein [Fictibacillus]KSU85254.1 hypothetical protein AS030_07015 [Fictibacillus enclensis]MDM5199090.1 DUF2564 family protein [Fictibacillus enclensis]MDM5338273.1 DUF2564 family protein [Fictibacillus enclensis]RXY99080.1 DUF2564 domain-containing protein [Fictibacillus sp. S7]WHY74644.1 DUF2564 family protein [Fictibacillus enclensis]
MSEPYNELKQVDMSIQSAQRIIGHATMSMDPGQLHAAKEALDTAKQQYEEALKTPTGMDGMFLEHAKETLQQCEQQINEALKP